VNENTEEWTAMEFKINLNFLIKIKSEQAFESFPVEVTVIMIVLNVQSH